MCNFTIPQLDFNLDNDNKTIENTYHKFKKDNIYSHTFNTRKELISIILFHFITRCSEYCRKKRHSNKSIEYKNNNPLQKVNIKDMLKVRLDVDDEEIKNTINKCDRIINNKRYTDDEKLDKLKQYHANLYRKNKEGNK